VCIYLSLPVECVRPQRRLHFRAAHSCPPLISPCGALNAPETLALHNSPRRPRAPGFSGEIAGLEEQLFGQRLMRDCCKNRPTRATHTLCRRNDVPPFAPAARLTPKVGRLNTCASLNWEFKASLTFDHYHRGIIKSGLFYIPRHLRGLWGEFEAVCCGD
jgi:hypothetical protein